MNIIIIEDERLLADELEESISQLVEPPVYITQIQSVKEGLAYFKNAPVPDLIFSDIQLGDGLSFEILKMLPKMSPVIFCTAYDEYALEAFKANGIDYILKPFSLQTLEMALHKYSQLKKVFALDQNDQLQTLMHLLTNRQETKVVSIIVHHQDKIIPIRLEDIALFSLEGEITRLITFSGKMYFPNKSLDELERIAGSSFFRANRQYLISRSAVIDASNFFARKLAINISIPLKEKVIVSKAKASQFLQWLSQNS